LPRPQPLISGGGGGGWLLARPCLVAILTHNESLKMRLLKEKCKKA